MITEQVQPAKSPATRQHFEILDGLRGIAAVVVVIFHFMEVVFPDYSKNFAGRGFLAVDFFFCLSGFVIAYAYDDRMAKMSIKDFFRARLIRLHPLVILGTVMGLITFLFDPFMAPPAAYGFGKTALILLTSFLLIPFPVMPERYFNLFSFNAPSWSLFWEYVANIFYGLILWRVNRYVLMVLAFVAAIALGFTAYRAGNLMGGWGKDSFTDGCARLSYSFLAGMLIYRFRLIMPNRLGFPGLTLLLLIALFLPYFPNNWAVELFVVLFYFPLLISLGAGARLVSSLQRLCVFSGKISYPLYMTHYGFIWIFAHYLETCKPDQTTLTLVITASVVILIGIGWGAMKLFDEPIRNYLKRKW